MEQNILAPIAFTADTVQAEPLEMEQRNIFMQ